MPTFAVDDLVAKVRGSHWRGRVCGTYSTKYTPEGYCVESLFEPGSVQIYPASALRRWTPPANQKETTMSNDTPYAQTTRNPGHYDRWTCPGCYNEIRLDQPATVTCEQCGRKVECIIEDQPVCEANLVEDGE